MFVDFDQQLILREKIYTNVSNNFKIAKLELLVSNFYLFTFGWREGLDIKANL